MGTPSCEMKELAETPVETLTETVTDTKLMVSVQVDLLKKVVDLMSVFEGEDIEACVKEIKTIVDSSAN